MRIAKAIARAGLCSRRDAERWIAEGRVAVNGEVLQSPARDVGPNDVVTVDGKPLPKIEPVRLWRYHKPRGLVTTTRDEQGRDTVYRCLDGACIDGAPLGWVAPVGRLDKASEGLLLLTNDPQWAARITDPATGPSKTYHVQVD